jgi:hypothetical protein
MLELGGQSIMTNSITGTAIRNMFQKELDKLYDDLNWIYKDTQTGTEAVFRYEAKIKGFHEDYINETIRRKTIKA